MRAGDRVKFKYLVTNGPSIHITNPSDTGNSWVFDNLEDAQQFMLHRWGSTTGRESLDYKGEEFIDYVNNLTLEQVVLNTDIEWKCDNTQECVDDAKKEVENVSNIRDEWWDIRMKFTDIAQEGK